MILDWAEGVKTRVGSALDRIDPVNLKATARMLANPAPASWEDMQLRVHGISARCLDGPVDRDDAVPGALHSRTSDTFADIILLLRADFPQFEVPADRPVTFTRIVLNVVHDEVEAMKLLAPDGAEIDNGSLKRYINLCSLVGNLFVRKLLAAKVIAQVLHDLIGVGECQPEKHSILCACELLQVIGKSLDVSAQGNTLCTQFLARLSNLAGSQNKGTREAFYDQDVRNVVKSVHESRFRKWPLRPGSLVLLRLSQDAAVPDIIKVLVAATNRECATIEGMDIAHLEEVTVKEAISRGTGIHATRIMVLMPDGETILR